jgi:hypothetical protein
VFRSKFNGHEISSRQRTVNASFVCSLQLTAKSGLPTSTGLLGFRPASLLASTKVLQIGGFWLSNALFRLESIRIVAPSPVGHPLTQIATQGMSVSSKAANMPPGSWANRGPKEASAAIVSS